MKHWMLGIALVCFGSIANATTASQPLTSVPNGAPLQFTGNLTFYGANTYRIELSTPTATPVLLGAGAGYLFGVECSSGATTDNGLALDSATASGITNQTQGKALTPFVYSSAATSNAAQGTFGKYEPAGGSVRFTNGLAFIKTNGAASFTCLVRALFDTNISATTH